MRKIYIAVAIFLLASIVLFVSSFIYLERSRHSLYHYVISINGREVAIVKIDRFDTEDKIIYKSMTAMPFEPIFTEVKERMELDRKHRLISYVKDMRGSGVASDFNIDNREGLVSFVARSPAAFCCLTDMPIKKYTLVFDENSPLTYMPFIENYDFSKGKSQGFSAITPFSDMLPPMKRLVTFTSIRDEYLKIEKRKIKTENLILKIRNYPQGSLWVAKSDKSLIMLEIPQRGLKITRTFAKREISEHSGYPAPAGDYLSREVTFNNKNVELHGTFSWPKNGQRYPAVLLVAGKGPQDRDCQGLFTAIAGYLAKNGFCVLRFDKRGVGASKGDPISARTDEAGDIDAALEFLASQKETDPARIAVIAHSEGAQNAIRVASANTAIRAVCLMAPVTVPLTNADLLKREAGRNGWTDEYIQSIRRSLEETAARASGSKHNWAYISGKRCFVKRVKEEFARMPDEGIAGINIPVIIMLGKADDEVSLFSASAIDRSLEKAGNKAHAIRYYGYLGRFFGNSVLDDRHKRYHDIDSEVLKDVEAWLSKNTEPAVASQQP